MVYLFFKKLDKNDIFLKDIYNLFISIWKSTASPDNSIKLSNLYLELIENGIFKNIIVDEENPLLIYNESIDILINEIYKCDNEENMLQILEIYNRILKIDRLCDILIEKDFMRNICLQIAYYQMSYDISPLVEQILNIFCVLVKKSSCIIINI